MKRCFDWLLSVTLLVVGILSGPIACMPSRPAEDEAAKPDPQQLLSAGNASLERRGFGAAFESFRSADDARPGTVNAETWKAVGDGLAEDGDIVDSDRAAFSAYERALKAAPGIEGVRWRQAKLLLRAPVPKTQEALALLDEEDRLHPGGRDSYNLRKGTLDAEEARRRRVADAAAGASAAATARAKEQRDRDEQRANESAQKARLRTQVGAIGSLTCRLEGYRVFGREFGNDLHSVVASGTFAGVLLQCVNNGRSSTYFPATAFAILDRQGRRFAIDSNSSFELAVWNEDAEIQNPEALQMHPGVPRFVQLMFELPIDLASSGSVRLGFARNVLQLVPEGLPAE